jgi:ubiquinone/menaquinone biosynthesis C-methylase UbiE
MQSAYISGTGSRREYSDRSRLGRTHPHEYKRHLAAIDRVVTELQEGMATVDDAKRKPQETCNAAADFFDEPALGFWDRFGRATVDRLDLRPGAVVLDACAGSGASALPAAERVGPSGKVIAVDLADNLLALVRAKADRRGVDQIGTRHGDIEALDYPPGTFDAAIIVLGVFFLPDMAAVRRVVAGW